MIVVQNQGQNFPQSNKICQLKIERHRPNQNQMEASASSVNRQLKACFYRAMFPGRAFLANFLFNILFSSVSLYRKEILRHE